MRFNNSYKLSSNIIFSSTLSTSKDNSTNQKDDSIIVEELSCKNCSKIFKKKEQVQSHMTDDCSTWLRFQCIYCKFRANNI